MSERIFPYATLAYDPKLAVMKVETERLEDGMVRAVREIDAAAHLIDFSASDVGATVLRVDLQVELNRDDLHALEKDTTDLVMVAVAQCPSANMRQSWTLQRSTVDDAIWSGTAELDGRSYAGYANLRAVIAGTVSGRDRRFLGESEEWRLVFDQASGPLPNGTLPVKWIDFTSDDVLKFLRRYQGEPFYADLEQTRPTVYLNKGFEGLPELFPERGRSTGAYLALHEAERMSIARSVWMALFEASLAGIEVPDDDGTNAGWPELGWQRDVLRQLLPLVYVNVDEEEALRLAARDRIEDARGLSSRAVAAIGRDILRDGTALRRAIKAIQDS